MAGLAVTSWTIPFQACGTSMWSSCTFSPEGLLCVMRCVGDFFIQVCGKQQSLSVQSCSNAVELLGPVFGGSIAWFWVLRSVGQLLLDVCLHGRVLVRLGRLLCQLELIWT